VLGPGRTGEALKLLVRFLHDERLFESAITALGEMRHQVGDELSEVVAGWVSSNRVESWQPSSKNLETLAVIAGARAVEPLIKILQSQDSFVREVAASTLGKLGPGMADRAIQPLMELFNDPIQGVRKSAARAVARLTVSDMTKPVLSLDRSERLQ
jgi:HEAT repeat protein